jgi:hypothetical protein
MTTTGTMTMKMTKITTTKTTNIATASDLRAAHDVTCRISTGPGAISG